MRTVTVYTRHRLVISINFIDIYKLKSQTKPRAFIKASWAMKFSRPHWTKLDQGLIGPRLFLKVTLH